MEMVVAPSGVSFMLCTRGVGINYNIQWWISQAWKLDFYLYWSDVVVYSLILRTFGFLSSSPLWVVGTMGIRQLQHITCIFLVPCANIMMFWQGILTGKWPHCLYAINGNDGSYVQHAYEAHSPFNDRRGTSDRQILPRASRYWRGPQKGMDR